MNTLETHTIARLPKLELHTFVIKRTVVTVDMGSQDKYILLEAPIAYLIMMFEKVVLVMTPFIVIGILTCHSVYATQIFWVYNPVILCMTPKCSMYGT